jgi:hypothetical protein
MGEGTIQGQLAAPTKWQPECHEKDDWLDKLPSKHGLVFDTTTQTVSARRLRLRAILCVSTELNIQLMSDLRELYLGMWNGLK